MRDSYIFSVAPSCRPEVPAAVILGPSCHFNIHVSEDAYAKPFWWDGNCCVSASANKCRSKYQFKTGPVCGATTIKTMLNAKNSKSQNDSSVDETDRIGADLRASRCRCQCGKTGYRLV